MIKKLLKKYKSFASDMILNMIGFGIYIVSQQIILLPILAKNVDDTIYSSLVLYLSILNLVCNVTGGELGNVRIIRDSEYKEKKVMGDFSRIMLLIAPIITIITFPILIYLKYSAIGSVFLVLTMIMANIRLYSSCYFRLEQKYIKVIIQNLFYLVGIVVSLFVYKFTSNLYLVMFVPELVSVVYSLINSDILHMGLTKTIEMINTIKKLFQLGFVSLLTNLMSYFDKFLIYPMFGAGLVSVYYAVNSVSKIANLITNPMSNVILSWVSNAKNQDSKKKIIKLTLISNIPILLVVTVVTIPLTYIALRILYSQYMETAKILIIPISITTAFGTASALIKSVLLKYSNTNKLVATYVVYFSIFAVLAYFLSKTIGILGFTIANLISQIILWILFIILLLTAKENKKELKVKDNA